MRPNVAGLRYRVHGWLTDTGTVTRPGGEPVWAEGSWEAAVQPWGYGGWRCRERAREALADLAVLTGESPAAVAPLL